MNPNILIFIPNSLKTNKTGFIKGFYKDYGHSQAFYITDNIIQNKCTNVIGYCGKFITTNLLNEKTIFIECGSTNIELSKEFDNHDIVELIYDFDSFKYSSVVISGEKYGVHIKELSDKICKNSTTCNLYETRIKNIIYTLSVFIINSLLLILCKIEFIIKRSVLLSHSYSSLKNVLSFMETLKQEKRVTPKLGNIIVAKLTEIALGFLFIYLCLKYEQLILNKFGFVTQEFVGYLRNLLIYLMGSPVGLKLNYAFNHSLAKFFFYHINLWRVFLQAIQPQLQAYFRLLLIPGIFGISYHFSMFCDIISIVTFHIYCIYVYAARLFYLQIKGLTALWRLFIGRKFNPLRSRIDSHEYSSNQLFVGTLGFTVLLFLLPTTTMYYTVFLTFRLVTLILKQVFKKIKNMVSNIPIYVIIMWIFQCRNMAGTVSINFKTSDQNRYPQIDLRLVPFSLIDCIKEICCIEQIKTDKEFPEMIYKITTGKLI